MRAAGVLQQVTFGVSDVRIFEDLVDFIKKPLFQRLVLSGKLFEALFEFRRSMKLIFHGGETLLNKSSQEFILIFEGLNLA